MKRLIVCLLVVVVSLGLWIPVSAEETEVMSAGFNIRQALFDTQSALLQGDIAGAEALLADAELLYNTHLREAFVTVSADEAFIAAHEAVKNGDTPAFANARATIWTTILKGSSDLVFRAVAANDPQTAQQWLGLREFRASTRFSRPGADATLAVSALANGTMTVENALDVVHADLLDTYQGQMNIALANADEAQSNGFMMRRMEETALASGYFNILSDAYLAQHGEDALQQVSAVFAQLNTASTDEAFVTARTAIDTALTGFRAAPLTDAERARRAGQLMRFIALVPVEYTRGVRDGRVIHDIEIQEAVTFYDGASAAFADLESSLREIDAEATTQIGTFLRQVDAQIDAVANPTELQHTVDGITNLLNTVIPAEWMSSSSSSDIDVISSILDQIQTAVAAGDYAKAESSRLEAYAILELGIEQRLRGFAPELAIRVESLFWQGTAEFTGLSVLLTTNAPLEEVRQTVSELQNTFGEAELVLNGTSAPAAVAGNAGVIVFREGLEAVLILASLLASLRTGEEKRYRRPLIAGSALAFVATAITWWLAHGLLNALLPLGETLEVIVSIVAIGVLLLITNWFFHKVYWTGWMANFHSKKRQIIAGVAVVSISQTASLVLLGFSSIYREGFETVLFLQSLVLEAGLFTVLQGVFLGLVGVFIVGVITFTLQVRLPYKKMLIVTGVMIGVVLLIMVGNTVHVMQSIGWLPITPIAGVFLPYWMGQWFGLFATWQGVFAQFAAAVFVIGSYFLAEHQQKSQRTFSRKELHANPL